MENNNSVSGYLLNFVKNLYEDPYPSSILKIDFYSESKYNFTNECPVNKCVVFYRDNLFCVFPYVST